MKKERKEVLLGFLAALEEAEYHPCLPLMSRLIFLYLRIDEKEAGVLNYKFVKVNIGAKAWSEELIGDLLELKKDGVIDIRGSGEIFLTHKADSYNKSLRTMRLMKSFIRSYSDPPQVLNRIFGGHVAKILEKLEYAEE
jgi:hypothetical protein